MIVQFPAVDLVVEGTIELLRGPAYAAMLAEVIADRADGISLVPFHELFDHEVDPEQLTAWPSGYVAAVVDERASGDDSSSIDTAHRLDIGIVDADSDLSALSKRIQRYALAVQLTMHRHGATMMPYCPTGLPIWRGTNWIPAGAVAGKPFPYIKAASVFFTIATSRDF